MALFGRHDTKRSERTAEDRERARRERAARRAEREGLAPPPEDEPALASERVEPPPPPEPQRQADPEPPGDEPELRAVPEPEPEPQRQPDPEPPDDELELRAVPEPEPPPPAPDPDPDAEPPPAREEPGATAPFTPAEEAAALGARPPREDPPADDATREFSAADVAEARGHTSSAADPDDLDIAWQDAVRRGEPLPDRPIRRIQVEPAAPPPAPAGSLPDTDAAPRPRRTARRARNRRGGAVMTPPGDVPRGPRRRGRRGPARIAALLAIVVVLALLLYLANAIAQPFAGEGSGRVAVNIPQGASSGQIGDVLADAGVVDSGFFFSLRANLSGARGDLRSGRHVLRRDMSYGAAIAALSAKPSDAEAAPTMDVTIPEGRSRREIRAIAQKAGLAGSYLEATEQAPKGFSLRRYRAPGDSTLEGFLFPATYELPADASSATLADRQLEAFRTNFAKVGMTRARRANLTPYDVLIIASMVEREARVARERPLIAAVIMNRLREGLPLGIDATIRYETNNWSRPLKQSELQRDTPYNTRTRKGLPPTPIGNPGLSSIRAAANPASRDYLYYVVRPGTCGEHAFSRTEAEFQRDVARYNAARAAAGGKSPTTCG
jgi:uncharacterized YceG family protein